MVDLIRHHRDYIQMANNYLKMCSRTSVTGEYKLKPQYTPRHKIRSSTGLPWWFRGVKRGFPVAQMVKNLPAKQDTWVQSLRWEDPLEKDMATPSSVLVWRIPWTEEPGPYSPWGRKESDTTEPLTYTYEKTVTLVEGQK